MATSSRRKARKEMMVSVGVAPGLKIFQSILEVSEQRAVKYLAVKQQRAILTDMVIKQILRIPASE